MDFVIVAALGVLNYFIVYSLIAPRYGLKDRWTQEPALNNNRASVALVVSVGMSAILILVFPRIEFVLAIIGFIIVVELILYLLPSVFTHR